MPAGGAGLFQKKEQIMSDIIRLGATPRPSYVALSAIGSAERIRVMKRRGEIPARYFAKVNGELVIRAEHADDVRAALNTKQTNAPSGDVRLFGGSGGGQVRFGT